MRRDPVPMSPARRLPAREPADDPDGDALLDTLIKKVIRLKKRSIPQAQALDVLLDRALAAPDPRLARVPRPTPLDVALADDDA